mgnify:CR=1
MFLFAPLFFIGVLILPKFDKYKQSIEPTHKVVGLMRIKPRSK